MQCADLGESFPTSIYLQNLASIQPRTSPNKFVSSSSREFEFELWILKWQTSYFQPRLFLSLMNSCREDWRKERHHASVRGSEVFWKLICKTEYSVNQLAVKLSPHEWWDPTNTETDRRKSENVSEVPPTTEKRSLQRKRGAPLASVENLQVVKRRT